MDLASNELLIEFLKEIKSTFYVPIITVLVIWVLWRLALALHTRKTVYRQLEEINTSTFRAIKKYDEMGIPNTDHVYAHSLGLLEISLKVCEDIKTGRYLPSNQVCYTAHYVYNDLVDVNKKMVERITAL